MLQEGITKVSSADINPRSVIPTLIGMTRKIAINASGGNNKR